MYFLLLFLYWTNYVLYFCYLQQRSILNILHQFNATSKCFIDVVMETETLVMNTSRRRMVLKPLSPESLKIKDQNSTNNTPNTPNQRILVS